MADHQRSHLAPAMLHGLLAPLAPATGAAASTAQTIPDEPPGGGAEPKGFAESLRKAAAEAETGSTSVTSMVPGTFEGAQPQQSSNGDERDGHGGLQPQGEDRCEPSNRQQVSADPVADFQAKIEAPAGARNVIWRWLCGLCLAGLCMASGTAAEADDPLPPPPPPTTPSGTTTDVLVTPTTGAETRAPGVVSADPDAVVLGSDGDQTQPSNPGEALTISLGGEREATSNAVKLLLIITVLTVAPGVLMMVTSFTRIIIVLGFVRRALGTQTLPPNQVMLGLALFLTLFVMAPTFNRLNTETLQPYLAETISEGEALDSATGILREFMGAHTRKSDLALFITLAGDERPENLEDVPFTTLVPAFITSELKTAFQMGFVLFLPFLVIDLVVAAILMALGMMMLPPVIVSLPFKILLFVLVDGWALLIRSLAAS